LHTLQHSRPPAVGERLAADDTVESDEAEATAEEAEEAEMVTEEAEGDGGGSRRSGR
jgi:hypothetical protein